MAKRLKQESGESSDTAPSLAEVGSEEHKAGLAEQERIRIAAANGTTDPTDSEGGKGDEKPKEPKDVRFRRLAVKRVPRAVKAINHVANLATKSQYEWTDAQRDKIITTLSDALALLKQRFHGTRTVADTFTL